MITEKFIILFGCKWIGQRTAKLLRENGYNNYVFATSLPKDWGSVIGEDPVMSLDKALSIYPAALVVVCAYNYSTGVEYCKHFSDNVIRFIDFYDKYPDIFLPMFNLEKKQQLNTTHKNVSDLLADKESVKEFDAQIWWKRDHKDLFLPYPRPAHEEYFSYPMILNDHENFVDCGAFDGDTIGKFIGKVGDKYESITAVEPNHHGQLAVFRHFDVALGSQPGEVEFDFNGTDYSTFGKGKMVKVETLDRLLDPAKPYLIKMDIEGAELDALHGATELLKAGLSKWTICLYHKPADLWEIPLFIHSVNPNYKLYIRRYAEWASDIILYVMP